MFALVLFALACSASESHDFKKWAAKYNKVFANRAEYLYRMSVFLDNKKYVKEASKKGEELELNVFADMTHEEFVKTHLGMIYQAPETEVAEKKESVKAAPASHSWRSNLGPAKDQGSCGSCWTFCTVAVLEARVNIEKKVSKLFSEQNMVDCDTTDNGCSGGHPMNSFKWINKNGGIATEADYPYTSGSTGKEGTCKSSVKKAVTTSSTFTRITNGDEKALTETLYSKGPLAIGMYASLASFQMYKAGTIYAPTNCRPKMMNHCVTLVGYGAQDGQDYWLIRNSWGTQWGDQGYFMMARNSNNMCGVGLDSTYPSTVTLL